jgi:hypothetical protein
MRLSSEDIIFVAFGIANVLRIAAYGPQIWCVARDTSGAQSISCLTWSLWAICHLVTAVYTWTHVQDAPLAIVLVANALCCAAVVVLAHARRTAHRASVGRGATFVSGA